MKIKILKNEYLFSTEGCHICDENGFATTSQEDCEIDVEDSQVERVLSAIKTDREKRGLDENGNIVVISIPEDSVQNTQPEQKTENVITITE